MLARDVRQGPSLGRCVVTNPPFALAGAIAAHLLLERRVTYLALLLKVIPAFCAVSFQHTCFFSIGWFFRI
jgi:hypothetical protein